MSALHPVPRVKHLLIPREQGRGWNKPWLCLDCRKRSRSEEAIVAHWQAEHCPKRKVLTDVECVVIKVEGEAP